MDTDTHSIGILVQALRAARGAGPEVVQWPWFERALALLASRPPEAREAEAAALVKQLSAG